MLVLKERPGCENRKKKCDLQSAKPILMSCSCLSTKNEKFCRSPSNSNYLRNLKTKEKSESSGSLEKNQLFEIERALAGLVTQAESHYCNFKVDGTQMAGIPALNDTQLSSKERTAEVSCR